MLDIFCGCLFRLKVSFIFRHFNCDILIVDCDAWSDENESALTFLESIEKCFADTSRMNSVH